MCHHLTNELCCVSIQRTLKYKKMLSLPYAIAKTMPDVMMEILDSGVTLDYSANEDESGEVEMKVKLDWKLVTQTITIFQLILKNLNPQKI